MMNNVDLILHKSQIQIGELNFTISHDSISTQHLHKGCLCEAFQNLATKQYSCNESAVGDKYVGLHTCQQNSLKPNFFLHSVHQLQQSEADPTAYELRVG